MIYKRYKNIWDFAKCRTPCKFGNAIKNDIITMDTANDEQNQLANQSGNLKKQTLTCKKKNET